LLTYPFIFFFLIAFTEVAFGSKITLKNMGWGGGLLHSHVQTYPGGSNQQQVTCYHYKDENNDWIIAPTWEEPEYNPNDPIRYLKDSDIIRLRHAPTTRNLHSHQIAAPVSKLNYEVSSYGNLTIGDNHDYWRVEVVDDIKQGSKEHVERIHSLTTRLRFKHEVLGCYLRAGNAILPQWGFKQIEVTCDKENNPGDIYTYWNVESHWNDRRMYCYASLASLFLLLAYTHMFNQCPLATPSSTNRHSFAISGI
jgi:dolichyl-phosphate-mannose-protein mannosyltransferase